MKTKKVCIGTARIHGLKDDLYYFNAKCYYAWNIMFSETSTLKFHNLPWIYLNEDSEEEAEKKLKEIKHNFEILGIHDEEKVAVLFDEKGGQVLAIAALGQDLWIDTRNQFDVKIFRDLNVVVTGLKVF